MELLHLHYFRTVAEELNFTHAAKRLFISQPALSMTIKKLERELDTELFNRNGRTITLTNQGRILLQSVEKIENELELVKDTAVESGTGRDDQPRQFTRPLHSDSAGGIFGQSVSDAVQYRDLVEP